MALNISPETVFRLRKIRQSEKFQTFTPETQKRLTNLDLQFDEEGKKHFITREDNIFKNPSLETLGKNALLQVPFLGGSLAAPTERNVLGHVFGRTADTFKNIQRDTFERPLDPVEIREPVGALDRFFTPARAFGANVAESVGAIGKSAVEGFNAPRGTVRSAFGLEAKQEKPITQFISEKAKARLSSGEGLSGPDIAITTIKATANDVVGILNDLALDPALNAAFLGTGPAIKIGAQKLAGTRVGVELSKLDRFITAVEKTAVGKGFKKRFKQNYGDFIDVTFKKGAAHPFVEPAPAGTPQIGGVTQPPAVQPAQPLGLTGPQGVLQQAAKPVVGQAAKAGATGPKLPPLDQAELNQAARDFGKPSSKLSDNKIKLFEKLVKEVKKKQPLVSPAKPGDPSIQEIEGAINHFKAVNGPKKIIDKLQNMLDRKKGKPPAKKQLSSNVLRQRARNILNRFKKLPESETKKSLKGIAEQLQKIIDEGPKEGDLQRINRLLDLVEAAEKGPKSPLQQGIEKKAPKFDEGELEGIGADLQTGADELRSFSPTELDKFIEIARKNKNTDAINAGLKEVQRRKTSASKPSPLAQGIEKPRPLTPKEIEEAKAAAKDIVKNMKENLAESAKRNKRGIDQEIEAVKAAIDKQLASGKLNPVQANVQRRVKLALEELQALKKKRSAPKKSKPITNTNTNIKGVPKEGKFKLTDIGKKPELITSDHDQSIKNIVKAVNDQGLDTGLVADIMQRVLDNPQRWIGRELSGSEESILVNLVNKELKPTGTGIKDSINATGKVESFVQGLFGEKPSLPEGKFKLTDIGKKPPVKKPEGKFDLTKAGEKPPAVEKPTGLAQFADKTGTGKFQLQNQSGKLTGQVFDNKQAAEGAAKQLNKQLKQEAFTVKELTEAQIKKKPAAPKKKTPLEEGIEKQKQKSQVPALRDPQELINFEPVKGKKVTQPIIDAVKKYIEAQDKLKEFPVVKGKVVDSAARRAALKDEQFAIEDLRDEIKIEFDIESDNLAINIINKILNYLRDVQPGLSIKDVSGGGKKPIDVGPLFKKFGKKLNTAKARARIIKKKAARFAEFLKPQIAKLVKAAKGEGLSVEEFIKANPSAFPTAPKNAAALQKALSEVFKDVPLDIKTLAKDSVVQFRPAITTAGKKAGDIGIVEGVGDVIKVRFKEGLATYTPEEAIKFLRESGQVLNLKHLPKKALDEAVTKILARNPKHQTLAEIANAAIDVALKNPSDQLLQARATQLTKRLIDALTDQKIDLNDIPSIAKAHGLTSNEIIRTLVEDLRMQSTEAGQTLNLLSQLSKKLKKIVTPEEYAALFPEGEAQLTPNQRFMSRVGSAINRTANVLKGFLTSQLKTASRNAFVQGGITVTEYANQIAMGVYQKISGSGIRGKEFAGVEAYNEAIKGAMSDIASFAQNLKKLKLGRDKERALMKLLEEFPIDKANLFKAPIHDVVINEGFIRVINAANILQETVYRSIFVEAELAKFAKQHGTTLRDIEFFKRHADVIPQMVEQALKNTFASDLKQTLLAGEVIKFFKKFPALGFAVGNPFIRFFFNNLNMLIRKSPLPLTNLFSPEFQRAFQGPNNAKQAKIVAEALQGVVFLAIAMGLRSEKFAGPKFYQVDITPGNKEDDAFFDSRPFAPLPQYLFAVEAAKNMMGNKEQTTLTSTDIIQGMLSVSRIAGTGLVGLDILRSEPFKEKVSPEQSKKNRERMALSFAGQILSAPTVPLAQFQDIIGMWDPEENKFKSTQQNPLLGPSINNIPFLKRILQDLQQIGRDKPQQPSGFEGMVEFFTGFRIQRVNKFEQELAKHGLSGLSPRMGDPVINQRIIGEMNSPAAQEAFTALIEDPIYKEADARGRTKMLSTWVSNAFTVAKDKLMAFDDEVGDFLVDKKVDRALDQADKKMADTLMDITLRLLEKNKDVTFSRTLQKVISEPSP